LASSKERKSKTRREGKSVRSTSSAGKLTPSVQEKILQVLRSGSYASVAARVAGISPNTFWKWMKRGRQESSGPYRRFYDAVQSAQAQPEAMAVGIINREMRNNWRAAIAYLERKFPKRWSQSAARFARESKNRRSLPISVRLQHDAHFLGEVARVLDESGALESVVANQPDSKMDLDHSARSNDQASGVSRDP
jgi:hypothetical protein